VVGGLGARGLVYHAWLGKLVAAAVAAGSDEALPPELLRWKMASDVCK
jgi:glycine/D-amino acid oxidase-like deaminating enzyme